MADEADLARVTKANARALASLWPAVEELAGAFDGAAIAAAEERGIFRAAEDEALMAAFGRFLTVREALWEVALAAAQALGVDLAHIRSFEERRAFLAGYAAVCLIVQLDRSLVEEIADHPVTRRRLDEGAP